MLNFCSLYSGSTGNSSLIQSTSTNILIDVGVSSKKIVNALSYLNIEPINISGILITHEHSDHIKGLSIFSQKYNIPVYANEKTWNAMVTEREKIDIKNQITINFDSPFFIGDLQIISFPIPHDAACPCGYNIIHNNKKISIATDIGYISPEVFSYLKDSSFALLESNYDPEILRYSPYPFKLKQRIASPIGHLSNESCGQAISKLIDFGLNSVMLGHLSKENNFPELAYQTVLEQININNPNHKIDISVANRNEPSKFINII